MAHRIIASSRLRVTILYVFAKDTTNIITDSFAKHRLAMNRVLAAYSDYIR
jgi:hypothetical protein